MAKTKVDEWDTVPANNADIDGISILGTAPASNMDNALRELMAQIRATPLREDAPDMVTALGLGTAPLFYDDIPTLLADTTLTYSDVTAGQIIRTSADGFAYEVAASGASDHHITTGAAGVVKLYALPNGSDYDVRQFGAIGDGPSGTDNTAELALAATAAEAFFDIVSDSITASARRVRLIFPPSLGFMATASAGVPALTLRAGVELIMQSPLWVSAAAGTAVVGVDYTDEKNTAYGAPRHSEPVFDVRRITQSDWASEDDIGVRIHALYVGRPKFKFIEGFTVGFNVCLGYGDATVGEIRDCRKSIVTTRTSPAQFTNQLAFRGGEFACGAGIGTGLSRYGLCVSNANTVLLDGQSYELAGTVAGTADCIPLQITDTSTLRAINQRSEGNTNSDNDRVFAQVLGTSRDIEVGILDGGLPYSYPTSLMLDNQTTGGGSVTIYRHHGAEGPLYKPFYSTGKLVEKVVAVSGSTATFVNMDCAANVGAAPATQTFVASGALPTFTSGVMTASANLRGVRVKLNGARSLGITGVKRAADAANAYFICFDSAGAQITTAGAVKSGQTSVACTTSAYGGYYAVGLIPADSAIKFSAIVGFTTDVATVFVALAVPIESWALSATDAAPEWFSAASHKQDQFVADAIPVALAGVTYKTGMRVERLTPAVGSATGWLLDSGGTWRALANL